MSLARRRTLLGRISSAAQRKSGPPRRNVRCLRSRHGRIEIIFMANFLQNIFDNLQRSADRVVLREVHGDQFVSKSGAELLRLIEAARQWLRSTEIKPGERCGLIAANSIHWIAIDLALMAEGIVVVPL